MRELPIPIVHWRKGMASVRVPAGWTCSSSNPSGIPADCVSQVSVARGRPALCMVYVNDDVEFALAE